MANRSRSRRLMLEMLEDRIVPTLAGANIDLNHLELAPYGGATMTGEPMGAVGFSVSSAGDMNGDGYGDVLIGSPNLNSFEGAAYVLFGGSNFSMQNIDLGNLLTAPYGGFTLAGFDPGSFAGTSADAAGDVNGDGFGDIIVGAPGTDAGGVATGQSYVIFGGANLNNTTINLNSIGTDGFTITGGLAGGRLGNGVGGAGDVNHDGFDDVVVGAPGVDLGGTDRGQAYVVFGGNGLAGANIFSTALGAGGFTMSGFQDDAQVGSSVDGAGDFNADGFADLVIGAPLSSPGGMHRGQAFVVFGSNSLAGTSISLNALGSEGVTFSGVENESTVGISVSAAGDVDADGYDDVIVGAKNAGAGGVQRGQAFVVFGGAGLGGSTLLADSLGNQGFTLSGYANQTSLGASVGDARDVNGDGYSDVIVGAPTNAGGANRGQAFVVFGSPSLRGQALLANQIGNSGFTMSGSSINQFAGEGVNGSGDINGDGLSDVIVGAAGAASTSGQAYIVLSGPLQIISQVGTELIITGTSLNELFELTQLDARTVNVTINSIDFGNFSEVERIVILADGGDDTVRLSNKVTIPISIDGGDGIDTLDASVIASQITTIVGNDPGTDSLFDSVEVLNVGNVVFQRGAAIDGVINCNGGYIDFSRLGYPIDGDFSGNGPNNVNGRLTALNVDLAIGSLFVNNKISPPSKNGTNLLGRLGSRG